MQTRCPYLFKCRLFSDQIDISEDIRLVYKYHYCLNSFEKWSLCKRFECEKLKGMCPDFVMPNSLLTAAQIQEKLGSTES